MDDSFKKTLGISLLSDYFNISYMLGDQVAKDLRFLCSKTVVHHFISLMKDLDVHFNVFNHPKAEKFVIFDFLTEGDKEILEDYFVRFNATYRVAMMIQMPDLFEGKSDVNLKLCEYFLHAIEQFFAGNFEAQIAIPAGVSDSNSKDRMFMLYDADGMKGLFKGSMIFKNAPIRFTDDQ